MCNTRKDYCNSRRSFQQRDTMLAARESSCFCSMDTNKVSNRRLTTVGSSSISFNTKQQEQEQRLVLSPATLPIHSQELLCQRHKMKVEEVRSMFHKSTGQLDSMLMIDFIQKLDIDYHFNDEIEETLESLYNNRFNIIYGDKKDNFLQVTLLFRLLRQARYPISPDVFDMFLDKKGEFSANLTTEIEGMVNLFEASHLNIGEEILQKAYAFTEEHLRSSLPNLEPETATVLRQTLENPSHLSLTRYRARQYLNHRQEPQTAKAVIQELARMDFSLILSLHQKELKEITNWWRSCGLAQELRFARDQPLKWYTWSMTSLPNAKFSSHRISLTKVIAFVYLLDDIFDVQGTLDKLDLLTDAIKKWDLSAVDSLPPYMGRFYEALYRNTDEVAQIVSKQHGWNPINFLKKSWIQLSEAFLVEAKWFASDQVPKADDYLRNGVISCGVPLVLLHLYFLVGQGAMEKSRVDLLERIPKLVSCPATILRLWDDLGSAEDEEQDGSDGSYLESFMQENPSWEVEGAREHVMQMISRAWEELNKESFSWSSYSQEFVIACLNAARMVKVMYSYDDEHKLPMLDEYMQLLLTDDPNV